MSNTTGDRKRDKEDALTGSDLQAQITAAKAVVLTEAQISGILQEAEHVLGAYVTARGTAAGEIAAHLVTGTRA